MTALNHAARDSATMLRRNLRHALRYPAMTFTGLITPVLIMLLFVGVFGRALGAGIPGGGRYVDYIAPGIIVMGVTSGCMATSVAVCVDMTEGVTDRFRTMPIARVSLLTGHVAAGVIQTMASTVLVVAAALALGFRPGAGVAGWLGAAGLLVLLAFALTWFAVALGLVAKTPEAASNSPMTVQFLPFLGSAIVPTATMPAGVRWFAEYQPFTPINEALRALLAGHSPGTDGIVSLAWCGGVALGGYLWSKRLFNRVP
ncbi:ABC transporter permease [Actinomadura macrotermitis]|uniref:Transport permease protein n=1 Tax=Actinomadura macrotermitis TaxID=2585200 RepID=A0A7K0BQ98_9ACTN|nr:Daunorubicin/doxorubicin resistance ABC transporter permease protein DrrB [Actinomadura macrotermitis]